MTVFLTCSYLKSFQGKQPKLFIWNTNPEAGLFCPGHLTVGVFVSETWTWVTELALLFAFASWDASSASGHADGKLYRSSIRQFVRSSYRGSGLFVSGGCCFFLILSTWTCTDTAASSWWKDSWKMLLLKSQTCPTSTRRIRTAATTEPWRTGSASWSRDSWLSSPSVRWCVSVRPVNVPTGRLLFLKHLQCHSVVVLTRVEAGLQKVAFKMLHMSPRGVLLTFVFAEPR